MIRAFSPKDISNFPEINILSYPEHNPKEYLFIKRKAFISCVVVIDKKYTILVEQFRPVIQQDTLEVPMGKIDPTDLSPKDALIRELQEECNLFIDDPYYLLVEKDNSTETKKIIFDSIKLKKDKENYLSPGFSNAKQYPFVVEFSTKYDNFLEQLNGFHLLSQESSINLQVQIINKDLIDKLDGISRYLIASYIVFNI